jgi:hypothetical protein
MSFTKKSSTGGKALRHGLKVLAVVLIALTVGIWLSTGAHKGFSKDRVEIEKIDPITQIEYVDYEERFIMGVEYLAAGTIAGLGIFTLSFFFARKA